MKKMRVVMVLVILVSLLAIINIAQAQPMGPYTCTINQVGTVTASMTNWPEGDRTVIMMTDQSASKLFDSYPFLAPTTSDKQMLATALTAISAGKSVQAYISLVGSHQGYGELNTFYIIP